MKMPTRAPARATDAKGRRNAAGTRRKTTTSRTGGKSRGKAKASAKGGATRKARSKSSNETAQKAAAKERKKERKKEGNKARSKTTTRAAPARSAVARAKETIRELRAELVKVRSRVAELQASADTDFLLGIFNRRGFERELSRSINYIKRYHATGAVIMLDVDGLKPINDTFGHAAGDEVLKAIAKSLAGMVRASDVVGRLGGDEFAMLLWNLSETDARAKAQALEQAIDALRFSFGGRTVSAGASAGIAILSPQTDTRRVLEEADAAMYVRKAQRRHEAEAAGA
jgi:diguanylate cyclase (GGDEF)-like protein